MRSIFFISYLVVSIFISFQKYAHSTTLINKEYAPFFARGTYSVKTNFDVCKMSLALPTGGRLWFDGDWSIFVDQSKQQKIKKDDAHIVRSRISWSVESPSQWDDYWLWISCDPPDDPQGISLEPNADPCTKKNFVADSRSSPLEVRQLQGLPIRARIYRNRKYDALSFCFYNTKHVITGGGGFKRNKEILEVIKSTLESISIDND